VCRKDIAFGITVNLQQGTGTNTYFAREETSGKLKAKKIKKTRAMSQ
jgi:hypothetical protein